jgi:hypothetical protein
MDKSDPVLGKPLSAVEVRRTTQTLGDGSQIQKSDTSSFYRDDLGRMRSESSGHILIFDPAAGCTYTLDPVQRTYTKAAIHANAIVTIAATANGTWIRSSSGNGAHAATHGTQPLTEDLAVQMVNGINARGSRVSSTIPAGPIGNDHDLKVISERWYSDDLQIMINSSTSDPRFGVTTYNLTNITQAVPDPSLLQPPADNVENSGHVH